MTDIDKFEEQFASWNNADTAPPVQAAKIPTGEKISSLFGLGPIPAAKIPATQAMVAEAARLDATAGPGELTLAEQNTRAKTVRVAENNLAKTVKAKAVPIIARIRGVFGEINLIDDLIGAATNQSVYGPNGELLTPVEARDSHDTLRDQVTRQIGEGSKEHSTDRRANKWRDLFPLILDFPVFALAMADVLNVNFRRVFSDLDSAITGFTALALAGLATVVFAAVLRNRGARHRRFKDADTAIDASGATRERILRERIGIGLMVLLVALLMSVRIFTEGLSAEEVPLPLMLVLSITLGGLVVGSGYMNYMAEFENGSELTDRVRILSSQLASREANLQNLRKQRALLVENAGIALAELHRTLADAEESAVRKVTRSSADKAITMSRSYCGSRIPVPAPEFNSPTITEIRKQTTELTAHHALLNTTQNEEK